RPARRQGGEMIRRDPRGRSGITLTEILISILILGVGMVSLLTLFPLGLLRLRNAARSSRSTYLFESAGADLSARNLLTKFSFITPVAITPYQSPTGVYDPWVQDTPVYGADWYNVQNPGAYRGVGGAGVLGTNFGTTGYVAGPGLPVAYDPLWRFAANVPVDS